MSLPAPRYSFWQVASTALALGQRALEEVRALAREPGPQGEQGRPGPPGVGYEEYDEDLEDDGRVLVHRWVRNGELTEKRYTTASLIFRGVWKEDWRPEGYKRGDEVLYASAKWIAIRDTKEKPEISRDWVLSSKSPRPGKSAYDIACSNGFRGTEKEWLASLKGEPGKPGLPGKDAYP